MDLLIYAVLGLAATWLLYLTYMHVATRAAEGRSAEPLYERFPALASITDTALVYCFSPQCGPCRSMSEEVEILAASGAPVFKFDITEDPALGRELGIRAMPTLIVIEGGTVARMLLGVKTVAQMQRILTPKAR